MEIVWVSPFCMNISWHVLRSGFISGISGGGWGKGLSRIYVLLIILPWPFLHGVTQESGTCYWILGNFCSLSELQLAHGWGRRVNASYRLDFTLKAWTLGCWLSQSTTSQCDFLSLHSFSDTTTLPITGFLMKLEYLSHLKGDQLQNKGMH
jgi:hypothetical protein